MTIHHLILPVGTRIGVYEIKDVLKISSFDITYRAWNHHFKDWVVVLEYFPSDLVMRDSDGLNVKPKSLIDAPDFEYGLKAFVDQAERLIQIESPNIDAVENFLSFNGTAYLIMSDVGGVPLSNLDWSSVSFTTSEFRKMLVAMLQILQKLHENNIIHGGIQPAAILLSKKGDLLLTDFCGARLALASHSRKCVYVLADGYAPVEQYEDIGKTDVTSDFYSLAATFYYCMTQQKPTAAQDRVECLSNGEADPLAMFSISSKNSSDAGIENIINRMLLLNQGERPQTVDEILSVLKREGGDSDQAVDSEPKQKVSTNNILWIFVLFVVAILTTIELMSLRSNPDVAQFSTDLSALKPNAEQSMVDLDEDEMDDVVDDESVQQVVPVDHLSSESLQSDSKQMSEKHSVNWYLDAAQIAINELRLVTPPSDNAYEYLQEVLVVEPENDTALLGLQKMVDLYIQFIDKARFDGQINTAWVYLLRAESILPDSPELKHVRMELLNLNE